MTHFIHDREGPLPCVVTSLADWGQILLARLSDGTGATIDITRPGPQPWHNKSWRKREITVYSPARNEL